MRFFTIILLLAFAASAIWGVFLTFFAEPGSTVYNNPKVSSTFVRGTIFDRSGNILAIDVPTYSVEVDSSAIADTSYLADCLARYCETPRREINDILLTGHGKITADVQRLDDLDEFIATNHLENYIRVVANYGRIYPTMSNASHLIARTESEFDQYLSSEPELGYDISYGDDVYLNLDLNLQYRVDDAISRFCSLNNARKAGVIIMDKQTGEILTYSVYPWFNLMDASVETDDFMLLSDYSSCTLLDAAGISAAANASYTPLFYYCSGTGKCAGHPHGEVSVDNALSCRSAIDHWLAATPPDALESTLSVLGLNGEITPLSLLKSSNAASGEGLIVEPYFISMLTDIDGNIIEKRSRKAVQSPLNAMATDALKILLNKANGNERIAFYGSYEFFVISESPELSKALAQTIVNVLS